MNITLLGSGDSFFDKTKNMCVLWIQFIHRICLRLVDFLIFVKVQPGLLTKPLSLLLLGLGFAICLGLSIGLNLSIGLGLAEFSSLGLCYV